MGVMYVIRRRISQERRAEGGEQRAERDINVRTLRSAPCAMKRSKFYEKVLEL